MTEDGGTPSQSARSIVCRICIETGISPMDALSKKNIPCFIEARHRIMRALSKEMGWSTTRIGRYVNRDHSTICHALQKQDAPVVWPSVQKLKAAIQDRFTQWHVQPETLLPPIPIVRENSRASVVIEASQDEPGLTRNQLACKKATEAMIAAFGSHYYSAHERAAPRPVLRPPPFSNAIG